MSESKVAFTSYNDALEFWNTDNDKIKVVYFYKKDCPYCDDFVPDILEPGLEARRDHFEWKKVCVDTGGVPFPPNFIPAAYFYVPNTPSPMPLIRNGGTGADMLSYDLDCMIKMKDQSLTIQQVFTEPPAIAAWNQSMNQLI